LRQPKVKGEQTFFSICWVVLTHATLSEHQERAPLPFSEHRSAAWLDADTRLEALLVVPMASQCISVPAGAIGIAADADAAIMSATPVERANTQTALCGPSVVDHLLSDARPVRKSGAVAASHFALNVD
jgi:hypothetical protein